MSNGSYNRGKIFVRKGDERIMDRQIIVIGAGAAGLSAALTLAEKGIKVLLVSEMPPERAQSVMAEGGMNVLPLMPTVPRPS